MRTWGHLCHLLSNRRLQGNSNKASLKLAHERLERGLVSQPAAMLLGLQVGIQRPCWETGGDMTQLAVGDAMSWE